MRLLHGWLGVTGCVLAMMGLPAGAETVTHNTTAQFAAGSFSDTEDTGSGSSPTVRIVYNLPYNFGNGSDGAVPSSGTINYSGPYGGINVSARHYRTYDGFSVGDRVIIHQSQGTGAGTWELNEIASKFDITGGYASYVLVNAFAMSYTTGSQMVHVPEYTGGTIGGTIAAAAWNGSNGGIVAFMANGLVTVNGSITAANCGFRGGAGGVHGPNYGTEPAPQGEGYPGVGSKTTSANGNGGGGGGGTGYDGGAGGGGGGQAPPGGGNGGAGQASSGIGGAAASNAELTNAVFGGGGGGGSRGRNNNRDGGIGGRGGGLVIIIARSLTISGSITATGATGGAAGNYCVGGGGGGAGGAILIKTATGSIGGDKIDARNGNGGAAYACCAGNNQGGNGSTGRNRIETGSLTGYTNLPTASYAGLTIKSTGTYTSAAINTPQCTSFGALTWSASGGSSVLFRTRSASSQGGLSSAAWSDWLTASGSTITSPAAPWIQYQAQLAGNGSNTPTLISVSLNYQINNYPTDPVFTAPANGTFVNTSSPLCTWTASTDADNDPVTYRFTLSRNADLSSPTIYRTDVGSATQYQTASLGEGVWYWQALAHDGKDYNPSPAVWSFQVDTVPPGVLALSGYRVNMTNDAISQLFGTGDNGTTLRFFDALDIERTGTAAWDGSGNFTFSPNSALASGSVIYATSTDNAQNTIYSDTYTLTFDHVRNVFADNAIYYGAAPGQSLRLEGATSYTFKIAVNSGSPVTVTAQLRRNTAYGAAAMPSLTLSGLGISGGGAGDAMTGGANAWEQLSVTGTPNADGVISLTVETFSTAAGAAAWIDAISVSQ